MNRALAGLFVLFSLAAGPAAAAESRELQRAVSLDARGMVSIHSFKGSIEIETWDEPRVREPARARL
jgi:hypothetical protein